MFPLAMAVLRSAPPMGVKVLIGEESVVGERKRGVGGLGHILLLYRLIVKPGR